MANEAKKPEETAEGISAGYVNLNGFKLFENAGDSIEGTYIGKTIVPMDNVDMEQYIFLTEEGIVKFNSAAQLSTIGMMPIGSKLKVVYTGVIKNTRVKGFSISMKKEDFSKIVEKGLPGLTPQLADPFAETK